MPVNGKNVRMYTSTETNVKWPTNPGGGIIFLENVIPGENYAFDITDETRTLATSGSVPWGYVGAVPEKP